MDQIKNTYQWLLDQYGPILNLNQTAKILHRTPNAVRKSACEKANPLFYAKRKIGRRTYWASVDLAAMMDGTFKND